MRMGEPGQLTGAKDRKGNEICIGDTLVFDFNEWNRTELVLSRMFGRKPDPEKLEKCIFVMGYKDGQLDHPGTYGDLSSWCEITKRFDGSQIEEAGTADEVEATG